MFAQHGRGHIRGVHTDEHVWEKRDPFIGGLVLAQGGLVIGAARVVVVGHLRQQLASARFQLSQIDDLYRFVYGYRAWGLDSQDLARVHQIVRVDRRLDCPHHTDCRAVFGEQEIDLAATDAVLARARAVK
jgi:hypothetical protein